jgi:glyoxylase-like metal-dependent hydrolase (beta-lactamase superfamily II)
VGSIGVGNGIHVVIGGAFPFCNTIVVINSEELIVIDPGCPIEELRSLLKNHNLELRDIDTVILTHIHPDHITHATKLNRLSRCRIAANEMTADSISLQ